MDKPNPPKTCVVLAMDGEDILGGLITDWYPSCRVLEIIYIAVEKVHRKSGIGTLLRTEGLNLICSHLNAEPVLILIEVDIPGQSTSEAMNPIERLKVWKKWGAVRIPFHYIQPPLSEGKDYADSMQLMVLSPGCSFLKTKELKSFLKAFYRSLNHPDDSRLDGMLSELDSVSTDNGLLHLGGDGCGE